MRRQAAAILLEAVCSEQRLSGRIWPRQAIRHCWRHEENFGRVLEVEGRLARLVVLLLRRANRLLVRNGAGRDGMGRCYAQLRQRGLVLLESRG